MHLSEKAIRTMQSSKKKEVKRRPYAFLTVVILLLAVALSGCISLAQPPEEPAPPEAEQPPVPE